MTGNQWTTTNRVSFRDRLIGPVPFSSVEFRPIRGYQKVAGRVIRGHSCCWTWLKRVFILVIRHVSWNTNRNRFFIASENPGNDVDVDGLGRVVAASVDDLHLNSANLIHEYMLIEKGELIGSTALDDAMNEHDILTGSQMSGTAFPPRDDHICGNRISSDPDAGGAMAGYSHCYDRGIYDPSWNTAHKTMGCSLENINGIGWAAKFHYFAID